MSSPSPPPTRDFNRVRIDRYTRASQTSTNTLTSSNLQPTTEAQTPKSKQAILSGSPIASLHTDPSTSNLHDQGQGFSVLPPGAMNGPQHSPVYPAQQARLNPAVSAAEIGSQTQPASPTRNKHEEHFERPRRSSSMILNLGGGPPPQPTGGSQSSSQQTLSGFTNQTVWSPDESLNLTRTSSSAGLTMEGIEPKIFPGVVSRRRRSSLRGSSLEEGEGSSQGQAQQPGHSGFRRGNEGSVVEEQDSDDDDE